MDPTEEQFLTKDLQFTNPPPSLWWREDCIILTRCMRRWWWFSCLMETIPRLWWTMRWIWGRWSCTGRDPRTMATRVWQTRVVVITSVSRLRITSASVAALWVIRRRTTETRPAARSTPASSWCPSSPSPGASASEETPRQWCQYLEQVSCHFSRKLFGPKEQEIILLHSTRCFLRGEFIYPSCR